MKGHDVIARSAARKETPLLRSEQAPQSPRTRWYEGTPCHCEERSDVAIWRGGGGLKADY